MEYTVKDKEFKSWNNDPNFKFNCLYFKFSKPYKVQVEFWGGENKKEMEVLDKAIYFSTKSGNNSFGTDIAVLLRNEYIYCRPSTLVDYHN